MSFQSFIGTLLLCSLPMLPWVALGQKGETPVLLEVSDYTREFSVERSGATKIVKIRHFLRGGVRHFLIVDADTLETRVVSGNAISSFSAVPLQALESSRYRKALDASASSPFLLENDGITRSDSSAGRFLTVDLCQSRRAFEKDFFERIGAIHSQQPTPVALCVTGRWMTERPHEFRWLYQQAAAGCLDVTWVNHSWSHPFVPDVPYERNFLLREGVDPANEIFAVEIHLLERGVTPSVFFRFPGLVSSPEWIKLVADCGLITVGADAWLALGQKPEKGSIILVHGNGNEPKGIEMLLEQLDSDENEGWFLPLKAIIPDERALDGERP